MPALPLQVQRPPEVFWEELTMSTVAQPSITADELLRMPDGDRFELVNGELVEREMGSRASWISGKVYSRLDQFSVQSGGWAFPDGTAYRCYDDDPDRVRKPDASYVRAGRLPGDEIPEGYITVPPDVARRGHFPHRCVLRS